MKRWLLCWSAWGARAAGAELEKLLGIVLRVCDAAALAHRCNLIHCNLEPGTSRSAATVRST